MPDISVIIPVYGVEQTTLQCCLDSVKTAAGRHSCECILVFDGNPQWDASGLESAYSDDAQGTDTHMFGVVMLRIDHAGVSAARNAGLRMAAGRWAAFVDADDMLTPGSLDDLLDYASDNRCDVVMGAFLSVAQTVTETHRYRNADMVFEGASLQEFRADLLRPQRSTALVWGKIYRTGLLTGMSFDETLVLGEDAEFTFRACLAATRIGYLDRTVYEYRRSGTSAVRAYRPDYARNAVHAVDAMRRTVQSLPCPERYMPLVDSYALFHLTVVMVNYLFNPDAPWSPAQRRQLYRTVLASPQFAGPLHRYTGRGFPITRAIPLLTMKYRLYSLSAAIASIRRHQLGR